MSKMNEAMEILAALGFPKQQQNERSALTLLALAGLSKNDKWKDLSTPRVRILDIMEWMKKKYGKAYAPNSRETIRRQTIHQFEQARIIDRNPDYPTRPTNSGLTVYCLTDSVIKVLKSYGTKNFKHKAQEFILLHGT